MIRHIGVTSSSETMLFAASELARYLRVLSTEPVTFRISGCEQPLADGITLSIEPTTARAPLHDDFDDAVTVKITDGAGSISGRNARSVLLGVYRLLYHLGCRWVRPGAEGEFLPRGELACINVDFCERPSHRHRTLCIEGAVSLEHMLEILDWAPKVGFSAFFMQFPDGYAFFDRWMSHSGSATRESEPISAEATRAWAIRLEQEVQKRGLIYHAVGHGWTCRALGMELSHWDPVYAPLTPEQREMIAEVNGVRALQWDRPMLTSLCFGRQQVRTQMVETILAYALVHPEVELLHVWLDDGGNNKCECAHCSARTPSDWYVLMLQELDAALSTRGCAMRIVFLGYSDLLWAPGATAPALPPERFVFMYANSRASYSESLDATVPATPPPSYIRNRTACARDIPEFNGFLRDWQGYFTGDSVLFEYYLCNPQLALFDQYALAHTIHQDIRQLRPLGLNGLISCQFQRVFFPSGMALYVMGQALWDDTTDVDALLDDYFYAACGADSALCKEFLKVSAEELHRIVDFGATLAIVADAAPHLVRLQTMLDAFAKVVERNLYLPNQCHARSWHYLRWYLRLFNQFMAILAAMEQGRPRAEILAAWHTCKTFLSTHEMEYHQVFDLWGFVTLFESYLVNGRFNSAPEAVVA